MRHTQVTIISSLLERTNRAQMWFLYTESCSPKSQKMPTFSVFIASLVEFPSSQNTILKRNTKCDLYFKRVLWNRSKEWCVIYQRYFSRQTLFYSCYYCCRLLWPKTSYLHLNRKEKTAKKLWCDFLTNFIWYCSICSTLSTCQVFSQVLLEEIMLPATAKCNLDQRITRAISKSTGINWVRLTWHISKASRMTYHFYGVFRNSAW